MKELNLVLEDEIKICIQTSPVKKLSYTINGEFLVDALEKYIEDYCEVSETITKNDK
jgi:hypothetical protein